MKTLFKPIHSLSSVLHDSPDVTLGNHLFGNAHDLLNTALQEEGNSFMVSVPVPGMSKEDLHVHIEGRLLVITTKEQGKVVEHNRGWKRRNFMHSFVLPEGIDTNRIHAKCRNGLLTVHLEKRKSKKRHIVVKVSGKENEVRNTMALNNWWERIKGSMDLRKFIPNARVMKTSGN